MIRTIMWLQRLHQLRTTDLENKQVTLLWYKLTQLSSSGRRRVRFQLLDGWCLLPVSSSSAMLVTLLQVCPTALTETE